MDKKEGVILVILVVLSLLILSAIFFKFSSDDVKSFLQEKASEIVERRENARQQEQQQAQGQAGENQTNVNITESSSTQQSNESSNTSAPIPSTSASLSWCVQDKTKQVQSDIYGEGLGEKSVIGQENVSLGKNTSVLNVTCEACHYRTMYEDTGRIIDEWGNKEKLSLENRSVTEECYLFIASKTFLYSNRTDDNGTITLSLAFSNKTYVKESWHDSQGKLCMYINKISRSERGAKCT